MLHCCLLSCLLKFSLFFTLTEALTGEISQIDVLELLCVANKITRSDKTLGVFLLHLTCPLSKPTSIQTVEKSMKLFKHFLPPGFITFHYIYRFIAFQTIKNTQYTFEGVILTPAMHRTVYAGMFACILVAGKLQW